jgi:hypothetical protein
MGMQRLATATASSRGVQPSRIRRLRGWLNETSALIFSDSEQTHVANAITAALSRRSPHTGSESRDNASCNPNWSSPSNPLPEIPGLRLVHCS